MPDNNLLTQIGLSEKEAEIYQILLKLGKVPASKLLGLTSLKRTTVYSILEELVSKGIVEKDESQAIIEFRTKHPYVLKEYIENQVVKIKTAESVLDSALPELISSYNTTQNKPGVRYLEGIDGFKKIYEDIVLAKENLYIFASKNDRLNPEMEKIINHNIEKQFKAGIKTQSLMSHSNSLTEKDISDLKTKGVEIHTIADELLKLPAQILIQGKKTVITSLSKDVLSTVVENEDIAQSMKNIFDYLWKTSNPA